MKEFNLILMFCLYSVISLKANTSPASITGIQTPPNVTESQSTMINYTAISEDMCIISTGY